MGKGVSISGDKEAGAWSCILIPTLKMSGAIHLLTLYALRAHLQTNLPLP
jgi:hypothetical protein